MGTVDVSLHQTMNREKRKFYLNTSTEVGNGEGNAVNFTFFLYIRSFTLRRVLPLVLATPLEAKNSPKQMSHWEPKRDVHTAPSFLSHCLMISTREENLLSSDKS